MVDLTGMGADAALRTVVLVALCLWASWWLASLLVAIVDPRLAARFGPPLLRGLLVGGVLAATVAPAHARSGPTGALDGLRLPERPLTEPVAPSTPPPSRRASVAHVVTPGESLWAIARRHSPAASDADLVEAVERWHATNRDVIGADPDLLQPGQRLTPPGAP